MTGILGCGKYSRHMKLPMKWKRLFAGKEDPQYMEAPFKVSDNCCDWMKVTYIPRKLKGFFHRI